MFFAAWTHLHIFQDGFMPVDGGVGHRVVDPGVKEFLLELFDGEPDSSPVLVVRIQVGLAAVDEDKVFSLPVAAVPVAVDLAVHPEWAVGQSLLLPRTLVRLRPKDGAAQALSVVFDSEKKLESGFLTKYI